MTDIDQALPDTYRRWLETAVADPAAAGSPPPLPEMLLEVGQGDPRLEGIARFLALSQQLAGQEERADALSADDGNLEPPRTQHRRGSAQLRRVLRRLVAEVAELRERNDALAAALGACYLCWGTDAGCPDCAGHGSPGSAPVDVSQFAAWIQPALHRLRRQRAPTGGVDRAVTLPDARNGPDPHTQGEVNG
jgi:hypothetical protein